METKHTPGPWGIPDTGTEKGYVLISKGDQFAWKGMIAQVDAGNMARSQKEGLANARLIAAAPDLLAALEDALDTLAEHAEERRAFWSHGDKIGEAASAEAVLASARAAIAKATGTN